MKRLVIATVLALLIATVRSSIKQLDLIGLITTDDAQSLIYNALSESRNSIKFEDKTKENFKQAQYGLISFDGEVDRPVRFEDQSGIRFNGDDIANNNVKDPQSQITFNTHENIGQHIQVPSKKKKKHRKRKPKFQQIPQHHMNAGYPGYLGGQAQNPGYLNLQQYSDLQRYPYLGIYEPSGFPFRPPRRSPSSWLDVLSSVTENDDYQCLPMLTCQAAARGVFGNSSLAQFTTLNTLLATYGSFSTSPVFVFGRAVILGMTASNEPDSCAPQYPRCPTDPQELIYYLNNYKGGFFRFFNSPAIHQLPQPDHFNIQSGIIPQFTAQHLNGAQNYGLYQPNRYTEPYQLNNNYGLYGRNVDSQTNDNNVDSLEQDDKETDDHRRWSSKYKTLNDGLYYMRKLKNYHPHKIIKQIKCSVDGDGKHAFDGDVKWRSRRSAQTTQLETPVSPATLSKTQSQYQGEQPEVQQSQSAVTVRLQNESTSQITPVPATLSGNLQKPSPPIQGQDNGQQTQYFQQLQSAYKTLFQNLNNPQDIISHAWPVLNATTNKWYYTNDTNNKGQLNFGHMLGKIERIANQKDDRHCMEFLYCEATASNRAKLPVGLLKMFITNETARWMSSLSPKFGNPIMYGLNNLGNREACSYRYPDCPQDTNTFLHYMRQNRGGIMQNLDDSSWQNFYGSLNRETQFFDRSKSPVLNHYQTQQRKELEALRQGYGAYQKYWPYQNQMYGYGNNARASRSNTGQQYYSYQTQEKVQDQPNFNLRSSQYPINMGSRLYNDDQVNYGNLYKYRRFNPFHLNDNRQIQRRIQNLKSEIFAENVEVSTEDYDHNIKWKFPETIYTAVAKVRDGKQLKFPFKHKKREEKGDVRSVEGFVFPGAHTDRKYFKLEPKQEDDYLKLDDVHKTHLKQQREHRDGADDGDGAKILYIVRGNGDPRYPEVVRLRPGEKIAF